MALSGTLTTYGESAIAAAYAGGSRPALVSIAVGDGNGVPVPAPTEAQTALVHEVWRGAITAYGVDPADPRRIVVETTVPATAGPFVIREAGIVDATGQFIAFTALAATEIVAPGTGNQATELDLIIQLPINSAGAVTVVVGEGDRILIERLMRMPFISINSMTATSPPANPAKGDLYIIPPAATGAWAAAAVGQVAEWNGTFWAYATPPKKMVAGLMDKAEGAAPEYVKWTGVAWVPFSSATDVLFAIDTGTADEIVADTVPKVAAFYPGQMVLLKRTAPANLTVTPTVRFNGLDDRPLVKRDGLPPAVGDVPAGGAYGCDLLLGYHDDQWRLLGLVRSDIAGQIPRQQLTAATDFYVATNGSDATGDGSQDKPWATLQRADNVIKRSIDTGGYAVTVHVADGVYTAGLSSAGAYIGNGKITFVGNPTSPTSVIIATSGGSPCIQATAGAQVNIDGMEVAASGGSNLASGLVAQLGGQINFKNVAFGPCGNAHCLAQTTGQVAAVGNYSIIDNAPYHWFADSSAQIAVNGRTVTFVGPRTFSTFAVSQFGGAIQATTNGYPGSGGVTGTRYSAITGGSIFVNGATLPGNAAGSNPSGYYS